MTDPEALFARLVKRFSADRKVTPPTTKAGKFGTSALKVDGKIFAFLSHGDLVVKLPRERVDELITSETGKPFDAGRGKVMKEWVAIAPQHSRRWAKLAGDARDFVSGRR
jgi:hypothetical protein